MKRIAIALLVPLAAGLAATRAGSDQTEALVYRLKVSSIKGMPATVPGQVVVQFRPSADDREARRMIFEAGGRGAVRSRFGARYRVTLDDGFNAADAISRLRGQPDVEYVEAVHRVRAFQATTFNPNDRNFDLQWNFRLISAPRMWAIQQGDPSVVVAVVDSGVAYEDFGPFRKAPDWGDVQFVGPFNAINGSTHANDDNSHGTHVASTIAEETNNTIGVAGLAFKCGIMPIKVLDANGEGDDFDVAEGIDHATNFRQNGSNPVKVINLSLGGPDDTRVLREAVARAIAAGITVVAAAGNDDEPDVGFPAGYPNVIAVGAIDARKRRASYSNFGPNLDIMAPGGDVRSFNDFDAIWQQDFDPDLAERGIFNDFILLGDIGTSMACPHVAAVAALIYRQGVTDPRAVKALIEQTAEDLGTPGRDDQFGHGMVRPDRALAGLGLNR